MPRSQSASRLTKMTPAKTPTPSPPTTFHVENSMTIGQSLKAGIGLSLGQRMVSAVLGPPTTEVRTNKESHCEPEKAAMEACMQRESTLDGCERMIRTYHACMG